MKITIDTALKLVLTNSVNLGELMDFLKVMLPDTWRDYSITATPTYILPEKVEKNYPDDSPLTYPAYPWWKPGLYDDGMIYVQSWVSDNVMLPSRFNFLVNEENSIKEEAVQD